MGERPTDLVVVETPDLANHEAGAIPALGSALFRRRMMPRKVLRFTVSCLVCGKSFETIPCLVKRGDGKCCSRSCAGRLASKGFVLPASEFAERQRAHSLVNMRIKRGKMERPKACTECGRQGRVDAHHQDYAKPGEVEFLCRSCHMKRHRIEYSEV